MTVLNPTPRRSRYRPESSGIRVSLKSRDLIWLEALKTHGALSSRYLHAFTAHSHPSLKSTLKRLTDLANEDNTPHGGCYLIRPEGQKRNFNAMNSPALYDLAPAAWRALGCRKQDIVRPTGPFAHQALVAATTASIQLATLRRSVLRFISGQHLLDRANARLAVDLEIAVGGNERHERHRLIPDALFALEYRQDGSSFYRAFAVECDRGTEPITSSNNARKSYKRSFALYHEFITRQLFKEAYGLKCNMVVLNIMNCPNRMTGFQNLVKKVDEDTSYFLFAQIDEQLAIGRPNSALLSSNGRGSDGLQYSIDQVVMR